MVFASRPVSALVRGPKSGRFEVLGRLSQGWLLFALAALLMIAAPARATTFLGPWVPMFDGIDHAVGTNTADGLSMPDLMVINAMRIDLANPSIQFYTSPPITNDYQVDFQETAGSTVTNFLSAHGLQVAVNANAFSDPGTGDPGSISGIEPEGTLFAVAGLEISQGVVVSPQDSTNNMASFLFTTNNEAAFIPTNSPDLALSTVGVYTAVTGFYPVLVNGVNIGWNYASDPSAFHAPNPRTAFGLSQDRRYLYIVVIDGRQPGYSDGALDWETAAWLILVGATDGANMDGGGSSLLAMADPTGVPVQLNQDCASSYYGVERSVGSILGIFANPVPSVNAAPHGQSQRTPKFALPGQISASSSWR